MAVMSDQNSSDIINDLKEKLSAQYKEKYLDDTRKDLFQDSKSDDDSDSS